VRREAAKVFVTKLGAAERLLNTAVRLFLTDDDELAVLTFGAAAYGILRPFKKIRTGRDDSHDLFPVGLFSIAQELASGKRNAIPSRLSHPKVTEIVEAIRCGLANGTIRDFKDVVVV